MANRIFPTKQNDKLDRSAVIKTIGIEGLEKQMDKMAGVKKEEMTKTASTVAPAERKKKRYAMQSKLCNDCGVEHPCSCDVAAAEAAGDHEKVASMMEARSNRRMAHIQAIENNVAEEELSVRTAFRSKLLNELQKFASEDVTAGKIKGPGVPDGTGPCKNDPECQHNKKGPCKKCKCDPCECEDNEDEKDSCSFASINKISAAKKEYFKKYAETMGWPVEYVEAITASSVKAATIPEATKLVLSNKKLAKENKKQIIVAMHKEAKLAPEQANRIKTYWTQELGYPDAEWVSDLVEDPTGK